MAFKKILITDSYSMNTGDVGILISMINVIKREISGIDIYIEASHPKFLRKFSDFDYYEIFPRIFDIERLDSKDSSVYVKLWHTSIGIFDSISFLVWSYFQKFKIDFPWIIRDSRKRQAEIIKEVDLVVSSGGGFLSTNYNYFFRLIMFSIALILGKPLFAFAQSIGPFESRISKKIIPFFLNRFKGITVREPNSYQYLKKIKINTEIIETSDIAFLLESHKESITNKNKVSICIKSSSDPKKRLDYMNSIIVAIKHLKNYGYCTLLVSQTKSDDKLIEEILNKVGNMGKVFFGIGPAKIKELYINSNFIISSRMHAIVFASEGAIPFISIGYEPKFKGLMEMLNYNRKLILTENEFSKDALVDSIDFMHYNRNKISAELLNIMPKVKEKSLLNVNILKKYL